MLPAFGAADGDRASVISSVAPSERGDGADPLSDVSMVSEFEKYLDHLDGGEGQQRGQEQGEQRDKEGMDVEKEAKSYWWNDDSGSSALPSLAAPPSASPADAEGEGRGGEEGQDGNKQYWWDDASSGGSLFAETTRQPPADTSRGAHDDTGAHCGSRRSKSKSNSSNNSNKPPTPASTPPPGSCPASGRSSATMSSVPSTPTLGDGEYDGVHSEPASRGQHSEPSSRGLRSSGGAVSLDERGTPSSRGVERRTEGGTPPRTGGTRGGYESESCEEQEEEGGEEQSFVDGMSSVGGGEVVAVSGSRGGRGGGSGGGSGGENTSVWDGQWNEGSRAGTGYEDEWEQEKEEKEKEKEEGKEGEEEAHDAARGQRWGGHAANGRFESGRTSSEGTHPDGTFDLREAAVARARSRLRMLMTSSPLEEADLTRGLAQFAVDAERQVVEGGIACGWGEDRARHAAERAKGAVMGCLASASEERAGRHAAYLAVEVSRQLGKGLAAAPLTRSGASPKSLETALLAATDLARGLLESAMAEAGLSGQARVRGRTALDTCMASLRTWAARRFAPPPPPVGSTAGLEALHGALRMRWRLLPAQIVGGADSVDAVVAERELMLKQRDVRRERARGITQRWSRFICTTDAGGRSWEDADVAALVAAGDALPAYLQPKKHLRETGYLFEGDALLQTFVGDGIRVKAAPLGARPPGGMRMEELPATVAALFGGGDAKAPLPRRYGHHKVEQQQRQQQGGAKGRGGGESFPSGSDLACPGGGVSFLTEVSERAFAMLPRVADRFREAMERLGASIQEKQAARAYAAEADLSGVKARRLNHGQRWEKVRRKAMRLVVEDWETDMLLPTPRRLGLEALRDVVGGQLADIARWEQAGGSGSRGSGMPRGQVALDFA